MTEKRFISEDDCCGYYTEIIDNEKELDLSLPNPKQNLIIEELVDLLNALHEENEQLKLQYKELEISLLNNQLAYNDLEKENEQLKQKIKGVYELLTLEVDVFSEKATEHDINAFRELQQLDNKDAFFMATATKKAIKLLKGDVE